MKIINLKDEKHFKLFGSYALDEPGFNRFKYEDRKNIKTINPLVYSLSTNSSGINARFKTDSKKIKIKVDLNGLAFMNHMSALGQTGLDLYVFNDDLNEFVFFGATTYDGKTKSFEFDFGEFSEKKIRRYILNLPLYMGVNNIELIFNKDDVVIPDNYSNNNKIIFYGTSITQGGCVSRPGMLHTNIISRWLDTEIYNYGFSGAAFLEKEIAAIISKVSKPSMLFIDAQANAGIDNRMKNNLESFINEFRKTHKEVPIVIASRIRFAVDLYNEEKIKIRKFYDQWLEEIVEKYNKRGDNNISYLKGENIFKKHFTEMTVDGIHPNDLGSMKISEYYYEYIKKILNIKDIIKTT